MTETEQARHETNCTEPEFPTEYYCRAEGPSGDLVGRAICRSMDDVQAWLDEWGRGSEAVTYTIEEIGVVG